MKKSILLLSVAALFSTGALVGCNAKPEPAPESSSEVDPEADWPRHEWSAEEKASINARFETSVDIASLLPFYYLDDLAYKGTYKYVGSFESSKGSVDDVRAYAVKLAAAGFEECGDSVPSHIHFRMQLSNSYERQNVLNVEAYMYNGGFSIDFLVGDLINDHSFPGRDVDLTEGSLFKGIGDAVKEHFSHFEGYPVLVMPAALGTPNNIIQIDFVDYSAALPGMFAEYYENSYYQYANVLEGLGVDLSPKAQIVFTSDAKKDAAKLAADLEVVTAAFEGAGFTKITSYKDSVEEYLWRNEAGYEVQLESEKYDDGTGQYTGHPAYVKAYINYAPVHDYTSSFKGVKTTAAPTAAIDAADAAFDYAKAYFEEVYATSAGTISLALGSTDSVGDTFTCEVADIAPYWYEESEGSFVWPFLELTITGWYQTADAVDDWLREFCGWTFVPADTAVEDSYDHYTYGGYEATFEVKAATDESPLTVVLDVYIGV